MGRVKTCTTQCHQSTRASCDCWCGGVFHGSGGAAARAAFRDALGLGGLGTINGPGSGQSRFDDQEFSAAFARALEAHRQKDQRPILETPARA